MLPDRISIRAGAVLVTLALAAGATGCDTDDGGGGGASPPKAKPTRPGTEATSEEQKAIEAVLVRLFKSRDARVICERTLTPRLFRRVYAGRAACLKVESPDEDDKPVKRVEVSNVETRGGSATADVRLVGGDADRGEGGVSLRKGKHGWRVDDLSTGFMRSAFTALLRNDDEIPATTARCIGRRFMRTPDARFKPFSLGLVGERSGPTRRMFEMWLDCERGRKGGSSLRRPMEQGLREELRGAKASPRVVDCVLRRLRRTLPDKRLVALFAADSRRSNLQLRRELIAAAIACGFQPRGESDRDLSPS